ncbi:hypothetical protein Tco_0889968 [Tanacetum coccineum]
MTASDKREPLRAGVALKCSCASSVYARIGEAGRREHADGGEVGSAHVSVRKGHTGGQQVKNSERDYGTGHHATPHGAKHYESHTHTTPAGSSIHRQLLAHSILRSSVKSNRGVTTAGMCGVRHITVESSDVSRLYRCGGERLAQIEYTDNGDTSD